MHWWVILHWNAIKLFSSHPPAAAAAHNESMSREYLAWCNKIAITIIIRLDFKWLHLIGGEMVDAMPRDKLSTKLTSPERHTYKPSNWSWALCGRVLSRHQSLPVMIAFKLISFRKQHPSQQAVIYASHVCMHLGQPAVQRHIIIRSLFGGPLFHHLRMSSYSFISGDPIEQPVLQLLCFYCNFLDWSGGAFRNQPPSDQIPR